MTGFGEDAALMTEPDRSTDTAKSRPTLKTPAGSARSRSNKGPCQVGQGPLAPCEDAHARLHPSLRLRRAEELVHRLPRPSEWLASWPDRYRPFRQHP